MTANRFRFRCWDSTKKKMIKTLRADGFASQHTYLPDVVGYYDHRPFRVLMQSTGLCDKNGKEIFEGDVVRRDMDGEPYASKRYYDDEVMFYEGKFGRKKLLCAHAESRYWWQDVEIIGNIYENPELLEESK